MSAIVADETHLLSPCVGTCRLEARSGWCVGCGRTGDEIGAWGALDAVGRAKVWRTLPGRLAGLGTGYRLLPWTPQALAERLATTLAGVAGTWWLSTGTLAGPVEVRRERQHLTLLAAGGRIEVQLGAGFRAFALARGPVTHLVCCLHRARLTGVGPARLAAAPEIVRLTGGHRASTPDLERLPEGYFAVLGFTPAAGADLPAGLVGA